MITRILFPPNPTRTILDEKSIPALVARDTSVPSDIQSLIYAELLKIEPITWPIQTMHIYYAYYQQEKKLPTREEIRATTHRYLQLVSNPDSYYSENKVVIPTNIGDVGKQVIGSGSCIFCLSSFDDTQVWQLRCGHEFHCGIEEWLKSNRTCPLCRSEVSSS